MWGGVIGDLAGSIYKYEQSKKVTSLFPEKLIEENSFFSDDTILIVAIIDAVLNGGSYEEYLRSYIMKYQDYHPNFRPYFKNAFSFGILKWARENKRKDSIGNGAMMRISFIRYLFDTEDSVCI